MAPAVNGEGGDQRSQPITHGRAVNIHVIPSQPSCRQANQINQRS
jgi:hypothetical protein